MKHMRSRRFTFASLAVTALAWALGFGPWAHAGIVATGPGSSIGFGAARVGTTAPQTLTASFAVSGYTGSFTPTATMHYGKDFSVSPASCNPLPGAASETCTFSITFVPTLPGARKDALFVYNGTTRLASLLVYGTGQGPYAAMNPGLVTAVTTSQYNYGSTVDENGTAYIVQQLTPAIVSYSAGGVPTALPITGLISPRSVSIDGAGVLYTHNDTFDGTLITYDTVTGVTGSFTMPVTGFWDFQTVDAAGNIVALELSSETLYRVTPGGSYTTYTLNPTLLGCCAIAVDPADNVFISGFAIDEVTPANAQIQINAVGSAGQGGGLAVDAADIVYATRNNPGGFSYGVAELLPGSYASPALGLDPGKAGSPLGLGLGADGTLVVGDYTTIDVIDRSQGAIAFGQQTAGKAAAQQAVQILNIGNQPLTVSSFAITGTGYTTAATGSLDCTNGVVLQPAAYCQVGVAFTPPTAGTFNGTLSFTSNSLYAAAATQTVALSGFVYGINVVPTPTTLGFGNQQTGTTGTGSVTLTNQGLLYSAFIGTPSSSDPAFAPAVGNCGQGLAPGASCQLTVGFTPTAATAYSATISLSASSSGGGPNQPVTISVSGTGTPPPAPVATLTATSLSFASTVVGSTTAAQSVTLSNTGNAPLTITGIALAGANPGDYAQTNTCGATLAAGKNCSISVTFTPTTPGSRGASLSITDNASGSPQTISLSGTGIAQTPRALLSPATLSFPATTSGTVSATQAVTLSNPGNGPLTIAAIGITGAGAADFTQTNTCGTSLAVNAQCTITVSFAPAAAQAFAAMLTVTDNAAGSPHSVALSGTGTPPPAPVLVVSPGSLSFAGTLVGSTAAAQSFTLSNTGNATLIINSILLGGANSQDYADTTTCLETLAPAANCTVSVSFTPSAPGGRSASVAISTNAGSPQSVTLTGTGIALAPQALLAPATVSFPATTVGTVSGTRAVTLSNPGTAPLTISAIGITGSGAAAFTQTNNCGKSLPVNATCTITLSFAPTTATEFAAMLSITDNATGSPQVVSLSSIGRVPPPLPGTLQFTAAAYAVLDSAGNANLTITRTGGTAGPVSVTIATSDGTAIAGVDYTATTRTVSFAAGDSTPQTVVIPVFVDTARPGNKTVILNLTSPTGGAILGLPTTATLTITQATTPAGIIQFGAPSYAANATGTVANVTVTRTGGSSGVVSTTFVAYDGTGVAGTDYVRTNLTVTFADGDSTAKVLSIPLLVHPNPQGSVTINLRIGCPDGGAVLGEQNLVVLTVAQPIGPLVVQSSKGGGGATGALELLGLGLLVLVRVRRRDLAVQPPMPLRNLALRPSRK